MPRPRGSLLRAPRRTRNSSGLLFQEASQEALATVPVPADTWGPAGPSVTYWLCAPELHCLPAAQRWSSRGEEALWCTNRICFLLCSFSALSTLPGTGRCQPPRCNGGRPFGRGGWRQGRRERVSRSSAACWAVLPRPPSESPQPAPPCAGRRGPVATGSVLLELMAWWGAVSQSHGRLHICHRGG